MEFEQRPQFRFGPVLSPAVKKILIITIGMYLAGLLIGLGSQNAREAIEGFLALIPSKALSGFQIWRFFTYALIHAIGPMHVLFNMLGLFFFGPDLERHFRSQKHFFLFYTLAAVAGGISQVVFSLILGRDSTIIGASACILAVITASAVLTPNRIVILYIFPLKLKHLAMIFVGLNIINALVAAQGGGSNIAHLAHLGGAAFGFAYIKLLPQIDRFKASLGEQAEQKALQKEIDEEREMDRLLAKIHDKGLGSLSNKEREFLTKKSRNYDK